MELECFPAVVAAVVASVPCSPFPPITHSCLSDNLLPQHSNLQLSQDTLCSLLTNAYYLQTCLFRVPFTHILTLNIHFYLLDEDDQSLEECYSVDLITLLVFYVVKKPLEFAQIWGLSKSLGICKFMEESRT